MNTPLVCPVCCSIMQMEEHYFICLKCKKVYEKYNGHFNFLVEENFDPGHVQDEQYIEHQKSYPMRVYHEFLKPLIVRYGAKRLLDVGCGLGTEVNLALKDGSDVYGVDLPNMSSYWRSVQNDSTRFFSCSAVRLPFQSDYFDFVWSFGVIEHIGTTSDTANLVPDYQRFRLDYINELVRVTRPGGKIVVSCPNKSFPIDIHHGPTCGKHLKKLRWWIFNKTRLNVHKTWGEYHLLSYSEVRRLFSETSSACSVQPLPLRNYFSFQAFQGGYLRFIRSGIQFYVNHLPSRLLPTFLNPYVLIIAEKITESRADESKQG